MNLMIITTELRTMTHLPPVYTHNLTYFLELNTVSCGDLQKSLLDQWPTPNRKLPMSNFLVTWAIYMFCFPFTHFANPTLYKRQITNVVSMTLTPRIATCVNCESFFNAQGCEGLYSVACLYSLITFSYNSMYHFFHFSKQSHTHLRNWVLSYVWLEFW